MEKKCPIVKFKFEEIGNVRSGYVDIHEHVAMPPFSLGWKLELERSSHAMWQTARILLNRLSPSFFDPAKK
jgi:hypothetical protein